MAFEDQFTQVREGTRIKERRWPGSRGTISPASPSSASAFSPTLSGRRPSGSPASATSQICACVCECVSARVCLSVHGQTPVVTCVTSELRSSLAPRRESTDDPSRASHTCGEEARWELKGRGSRCISSRIRLWFCLTCWLDLSAVLALLVSRWGSLRMVTPVRDEFCISSTDGLGVQNSRKQRLKFSSR